MSGNHDHSLTAVSGFHLNATVALGTVYHGANTPMHAFRVFNLTLISLALCVLAITGLYCAIALHRRRRMSKRAHVYESAVGGGGEEPAGAVDVRAVKRSTSFRNPLALFRKQEGPKDNSRIYYIYSNPLPVGLEEEEEARNSTLSGLEVHGMAQTKELTIEDYAKDPASGIILDPPNFYMQL